MKKVTEVPWTTAAPELSLSAAVIVVELKPSAGMLAAPAESVIDAVLPSPPPVSPPPTPHEARRAKAQILTINTQPYRRYFLFITGSFPIYLVLYRDPTYELRSNYV